MKNLSTQETQAISGGFAEVVIATALVTTAVIGSLYRGPSLVYDSYVVMDPYPYGYYYDYGYDYYYEDYVVYY